ncbi:MAG: hypothetical protein ACP5RC_04695 [Halothiobacillaceae bacterium]
MNITLESRRTIKSPPVSLAAATGAGIWAGLISGVIVLAPVLTLQLSRGIGVIPEMQLAASSVIGISAYDGAVGLVLGILLHFFVATVPAITYALIVRRFPILNRWAWLGGPVLGLLVFLVMGFIVLPQTAFITPPSVTPMPPVPALLIHMFGLGLPISLVIRTVGPLREGGRDIDR